MPTKDQAAAKKAGANNWSVFQKGREKTGGRKKGVKNKITRKVSEVFEEAFERLGGADALVEFAADEPSEFYRLYGKMLPRQIDADITSNGQTLESPITAKDAAKLINQLNKGSAK